MIDQSEKRRPVFLAAPRTTPIAQIDSSMIPKGQKGPLILQNIGTSLERKQNRGQTDIR